jgi:hypothetical protein
MNQFPNVPFTLNRNKEEDGDRFLLHCLQEELTFCYLPERVLDTIHTLRLDGKSDDFRFLHDDLLKLWPLVLTGALLELKKHDTREFDSSNPHMEEFFDPTSLGIAELEEVLKGFSDFEGMMYGASPERYRDHVAHSFRVWIVGHGLLQSSFHSNLQTPKSVSGRIAEPEWECMWAIVALCHDVGYPLSHVERINERARDTLKKQGLMHEGDLRFSFSQQMMPFHDTIIKLIASDPIVDEGTSKYLTHVQTKYYLKLLKSFDRLDHGIVSSLLISRALVYFLESDLAYDSRKPLDGEDIRQFFIRREILRAIAAHTCQDIYHLTFDNLSLLLYMVDEIQCWGRPTLEETQHEAINVSEGYAEVEKFDEKKIVVRIATQDSQWEANQQRGVLAQVLKLRRMLRLAVGRKDHLDRHLEFSVRNVGAQAARLQLDQGSLRLSIDGFDDSVIADVPELKASIKEGRDGATPE